MRCLWALVAIMAFAVLGGVLDRHPTPLSVLRQPSLQDSPDVPAKQKANGAGKRQIDSDNQTGSGPYRGAAIKYSRTSDAQREGGSYPNESADETTEYWTLLGHRLKITDTLLAIFTFALCLIGWWQGGQLKKTVIAMKDIDERQSSKVAESIAQASRAAAAMEDVAKAMNISALAAQQSARAAITGNQTAVNSAITLNRSYIYFRLINDTVDSFLSGDSNQVEFTWDAVNFGRTPGRIVGIGGGVLLSASLPLLYNRVSPALLVRSFSHREKPAIPVKVSPPN